AMLMIFYPLVITRWIHFACVFLLFGAPFFWLYEKTERCSAIPQGLPRSVRATANLLRFAAPIAAASGVAWLALVLINMTRYVGSIYDPEDLDLYFFDTPFGTVSFLRLALFAIAVVIVFLPLRDRLRFGLLVPVSALLLITQAWFGHSNDGSG